MLCSLALERDYAIHEAPHKYDACSLTVNWQRHGPGSWKAIKSRHLHWIFNRKASWRGEPDNQGPGTTCPLHRAKKFQFYLKHSCLVISSGALTGPGCWFLDVLAFAACQALLLRIMKHIHTIIPFIRLCCFCLPGPLQNMLALLLSFYLYIFHLFLFFKRYSKYVFL